MSVGIACVDGLIDEAYLLRCMSQLVAPGCPTAMSAAGPLVKIS
jgi:hypothetical protein